MTEVGERKEKREINSILSNRTIEIVDIEFHQWPHVFAVQNHLQSISMTWNCTIKMKNNVIVTSTPETLNDEYTINI